MNKRHIVEAYVEAYVELEKENAELKARLAHVESEYAKECKISDEIYKRDEIGFPDFNILRMAKKLARQRIKERKEFK